MCTGILGAIAVWCTARRTGLWNGNGCGHSCNCGWNNRCGCRCNDNCGWESAAAVNACAAPVCAAPAPVVTNACDAIPAEIWESVNRRGCGCNSNCRCR